ncbi:ABC transporter ATP-binding protein [Chloroflexi bacterium TSY]|nr:ABC transporter ATP-binding protein [Chloroflexi bacterium TSY]
MSTPVLEVRDLKVYFKTLGGIVKSVDGMSFTVERGTCLGIVGESGCGKSVTARSILRLLPDAMTSGDILYRRNGSEAINLAELDPESQAIREIRGKEIAMIFQEPMTSLTPVYTIGEQITEGILVHQNVGKAEARQRAAEMLDLVGIPDSESRLNDIPAAMSGGMRQRVMIAMALACQPTVLIADEPTTALDVTIQAQFLRLLRRLQQEMQMALIQITHDLAVVAQTADHVLVMYLGQMVEQAPVKEFFENPKHPYSQGLLNSIILPTTEPKSQLSSIPGSVPDPLNAPSGCRFRNRCSQAHDRCSIEPPVLDIGMQHRVACWLYES